MLRFQDLMHACIHASTPKMHHNILLVLDGLHSQKKASCRGRGGEGIDLSFILFGLRFRLKALVVLMTMNDECADWWKSSRFAPRYPPHRVRCDACKLSNGSKAETGEAFVISASSSDPHLCVCPHCVTPLPPFNLVCRPSFCYFNCFSLTMDDLWVTGTCASMSIGERSGCRSPPPLWPRHLEVPPRGQPLRSGAGDGCHVV